MATPSSSSTAAAASSSQVTAHLVSKHLQPKPSWLSQFLFAQKPTTPLPALKQTARFRLLASDITKTLDSAPASAFPTDILDGDIIKRRLAGPMPVQVIGLEDIGQSRWGQVDAIEAAERGETTKGRQIVRVVPGEEGLSSEANSKAGPYKLLLQDVKGVKVYAFELNEIDGVNTGMSLGAKMVLKDVSVARGVLLLTPASASLLGGKIEALDKIWREGRKQKLKDVVNAA